MGRTTPAPIRARYRRWNARLETFKFWVRQDNVFLIEYARLLALAVTRSPKLETMRCFARLLNETLETEMDLHRAYAAEFGISPAELECETPAPTTRAYTDFLLRVAATGDYAELVAALLPCMWGFSEIGQRLATWAAPKDERYFRVADHPDTRSARDLQQTICRAQGSSQKGKRRYNFHPAERWGGAGGAE